MTLLHGRRVLITGGTAGIGAATARRCVAEGASVAVLSRNKESLDALSDEIGCYAIQSDVTSPESARLAVHDAAAVFGGLDVVINNAGISPYGEFESSQPATWKRVFDVNVLGTLHITHASLVYLRESQAADIVMLGSAATHRPPTALNGIYAAAKAAVSTFTDALRTEVQEQGIRVTMVSPGAVNTGIFTTLPDDALREALSTYLREWGVGPDDVARQIVRALSEPRHVSLQEILVVPFAAPAQPQSS